MTTTRTVLIPSARVVRWFDNFAERHGPASYDVRGGALHGTAADDATAVACSAPPRTSYDAGPCRSAKFSNHRTTRADGISTVRVVVTRTP